jgi:hypothetical protein
MKKRLFLLLYITHVLKLFSQNDHQVFKADSSRVFDIDISVFQIGKKSSIDIRNSKEYLLVDPATFAPYVYVRSDNCIFVVASNDDNIVRFIGIIKSFTNDGGLSFLTPEGIHIDMSYKSILEILPNLEVKEVPGWGYSAKLSSGWNIGFSMVNRVPTLCDTIDMIYMD